VADHHHLRHRRAIAGYISGLAVMLAMSCIGCSAGSSAQDSSSTTLVTLVTTVAAAPSDIGSLQSAILADGVVTDAEFNSANQAAAECIRRLGFGAEVLPGGGMRTSYEDGQEDALDAAQYTCETEYNTQVQLRYAVGHLLPSEFDLEAIWDCLEERGIVDRATNADPVEAFQLADAANSQATGECMQTGRGG